MSYLIFFFQTAQAVSASQDRLTDILGRVGQIFRELELKNVTLPGSRKDIIEKILLVVLSVLTTATEDIIQGRASRFILGIYVVIYSPVIRKVLEKVDWEE
jgi:hypothetical protein